MWQTYVAIGDSVTEGYGDPAPGVALRSWTDWVAEALASLQPAFRYINLGLRGSATTDVLRSQAPAALEAEPDLVSVTTGANDALRPGWSADLFARNFEQLLQPFAERKATIITLAYPDFRPAVVQSGQALPSTWAMYFQRMAAANAVIRQVSDHFQACLLDFEAFAPAQDPACISSDLVHPNALGYKQAAEAALQILAERFDLPPYSR